MNTVPLASIPNQSFGTRLDGARYVLEFSALRDATAVTIYRDNVLIVSGLRAVAGSPLIPFKYLESGNFIFITEDDQLPDWRLFGSTQTLVFLSQAEIDAL